MQRIFAGRTKSWKSLDYVAGWFMKAADYGLHTKSVAAFVSTNSVCQGQQVPILWPLIFETGHVISFAHTSFKWANLASHNAGVTVAIVAISNHLDGVRRVYSVGADGTMSEKQTDNINAYLVPGPNRIIDKVSAPISAIPRMIFGNKVVDDGNLRMNLDMVIRLGLSDKDQELMIRKIVGTADFIKGEQIYCLWIADENLATAISYPAVAERAVPLRQVVCFLCYNFAL